MFDVTSKNPLVFIIKSMIRFIILIVKIRNKKIKCIIYDSNGGGYFNKLGMKGDTEKTININDANDNKNPKLYADLSPSFNNRLTFKEEKPKKIHIITPIKRKIEQTNIMSSSLFSKIIQIIKSIRYIEYKKNITLKIRCNRYKRWTYSFFFIIFVFSSILYSLFEKYYLICINIFGGYL